MIPAVKRCQELLETYPSFRDHVEVIEEARRVLLVDGGERLTFMNDCVQRLVEELDLLIYYGVNEKGMSPPKSPKLDAKIIYLLKNLPVLFGRQKLPKKKVELIHEMKHHEDPDSWTQKQNGNLPVLVYDKDSVYVIVGRKILFQVDSNRFAEATIGFLGAFYLLDYDYPKHWEIGMNMLQYFVFEDRNYPEDTSDSFNQVLKEYKQYKSEV